MPPRWYKQPGGTLVLGRDGRSLTDWRSTARSPIAANHVLAAGPRSTQRWQIRRELPFLGRKEARDFRPVETCQEFGESRETSPECHSSALDTVVQPPFILRSISAVKCLFGANRLY
jgi:hypothetical protein